VTRIGIDGACWLNRRGYGRFTRELLTALAARDGGAEYTLLVDFDPAEAPAIPSTVQVVRIASGQAAARAAAAGGRRSVRDMWATSRALSQGRFDIILFPSAYTYVPVSGPGRVMVGIHDVIAEQFPQHVFPDRRAAALWRLKLFAARRQADLIFTVSQASRRGIAARFGIPAERIAVVSEAAERTFRTLAEDDAMHAVLKRWDLTKRRFVLYVGGISPHKNLAALVDAFAALRRRTGGLDYRLVLVGDYSGDVFYSAYEPLRQQIQALDLAHAVLFTGYVADQELVHLYNAAACFVLPSLWEGFGLPVLEAMACGAPVVASARGALPEIVGAAGLLFDPERQGDLCAVLARLLADADLQADLRRLGPQRAAEYSWDRAAREALAAFRQLTRTSRALAAGAAAAETETAREGKRDLPRAQCTTGSNDRCVEREVMQ
jgi:glycosyltransferase involved in cell wall biosynthesis